MLLLILLTFFVFLVLWVGDFYLTLKTSKKIGSEIEINPILRTFLRFRGRYVWIFKTIELGLFFYLIYFLTSFGEIVPFYILLGYIVLYGLLVANNSGVYYKATGEESSAFKYIFVAIVILIALFIFLDRMNFSNLTISYNALASCQSEYTNLYFSCRQQNVSVTPISTELTDILKSLNLTISKPW